ncbi:MAG: hypothetical protein ABFR47_02555 [Verrucomicrobiota bacterium]
MRRILSILILFCAVAVEASFDWDPLYESLSATNGMEFLAVRPFYSRVDDPASERWRKDYLWPVYTRKGFKDETYSRFLFFGYSVDFSEDDDRHRTWVLPFYFQGVDASGEGYFALFPFGGTIHEFAGRDEIMFALFPVYSRSQVNDVRTTSVFWPIYSRSQGEKVDRLRVWPFYGRTDLRGEYRKKFIAWPFYTSVKYTNDRNPGGGFILLPVYGRVKTERSDNYWVVPPLFRYMTSDEQWIVHAPWPFIQLADGTMHKRIFWPLYGKKSLGTLTRQYFLWPFIWNNKTEYARHTQHRRVVVPFVASESDVVTKKTGEYEVGDVSSRYWKIWPLMSWERKHGNSRFRTLELWPMRNTPGIERNWAPWWTLYRRVDTDGEIGHHLLWGLYRQTKSPEQFEWSLLKGFAGYKKMQNSRRYRFLFMWFGGGEESP